MDTNKMKALLESGQTYLGIEFGSTRIKAVLVSPSHEPVALGSHEWENRLESGIWTYSEKDIWQGLQNCYQNLRADVKEKYGVSLKRIGAMGFSAMMHGYLVFDKAGNLLTPFRTWRNTMTAQAAEELTALFNFNIPQRWSIAHLYQAILNGEAHVRQVDFITSLAGFAHWRLTGVKALGVGDASGVVPVDSQTLDYDETMIAAFDEKVAGLNLGWKLKDILPKVLNAGENAGALTEEGAKLLDVSGELLPGVPFCPPEGDAGTGMVATNSVRKRTGNVSAGTSVFAMIVLEKAFERLHTQIDMVTTPTGAPVAMVHCNNCTSDLNAWAGLFNAFAKSLGHSVSADVLYGTLLRAALEGDKDCGGLMAYNYLSGEHITEFEEGRPLVMRMPDASFTLPNFMRAHLYSALGTLKIGMDILLTEEHVAIDRIFGHGGLFKTQGVGQKILAAAINTPVSILNTASEGGAWGIAILAAYLANHAPNEALEDYLEQKVFAGQNSETIAPDPEDVQGFETYMRHFKACLTVEGAAVKNFRNN